ncbi:MAG: 30S ribosomal protein S6 [Candidatus Shikimatogenerans bostrichidophilus]|nr:MAG: 30S ribosomal protein S6 [Candidatus Shikimatogenerans bostrichidophilus]
MNIIKRHYETIIVFTPVLSDNQIKNAYIEYKDFLIKNNVNIIKKEEWGMKKLAYTIKKKNNGFFYLFEYESETFLIKKLNNKLIQDERIIRFLTVKMNKHAIEYSLNRKINKINNNKENDKK